MNGAATLQQGSAARLLDVEPPEGAWALRSLVFTCDGSCESAAAREAAVHLARHAGAAVHVVTTYVGGLPAALLDENSPQEPWYAANELLRRETAAMRDAGVTVLGSHLGVLSVSDATLRVATQFDADLIVIGSRDLHTARRIMLGNNAGEFIHAAHRPVLVMRGGERVWPPARVIVGFDHSPEAMRAATVAATIASLYRGVDVTLLEAIPESAVPEAALELQSTHTESGARLQCEREHLQDHAASLARRFDARVIAEVVPGDPRSVLFDVAQQRGIPQLVVVGTRGLGRMKRFMLGSVSSLVLDGGCGPTLVVPGSAALPSRSRAPT
ncbi:MAG: universal stress protein [Candidatus Dormibacteraeota bacterium]|nr:universal stress protein [Candidatus Dormibacteraeota bacterium]